MIKSTPARDRNANQCLTSSSIWFSFFSSVSFITATAKTVDWMCLSRSSSLLFHSVFALALSLSTALLSLLCCSLSTQKRNKSFSRSSVRAAICLSFPLSFANTTACSCSLWACSFLVSSNILVVWISVLILPSPSVKSSVLTISSFSSITWTVFSGPPLVAPCGSAVADYDELNGLHLHPCLCWRRPDWSLSDVHQYLSCQDHLTRYLHTHSHSV